MDEKAQTKKAQAMHALREESTGNGVFLNICFYICFMEGRERKVKHVLQLVQDLQVKQIIYVSLPNLIICVWFTSLTIIMIMLE